MGLGKQIKQWCDDATQELCSRLMSDLRTSTPDLLRYCSNVTSFPSEIFVPNIRAHISDINDKRKRLLYSEALLDLNKNFQPAFHLHCPKELTRFLCECIVNLIEGNITVVRRNQFNRIQKQHRKLTSKPTLSSRRLILCSQAGLTILSYIYQPCMNKLSTFFNEWGQKVCSCSKRTVGDQKKKLSDSYSEIHKKEETVFPVIKKAKEEVGSEKINRLPKELQKDLEFHHKNNPEILKT